ncbi:MAG TPA: IS21-like element helper ATPase IstB [Polyangia bacterium]|jgi:DNA replication protein|nr:IS21-like element helper ATPase IstB [Polyangia bacterium]
MTAATPAFTLDMEARLGDLLSSFKLPTISAELVERMTKAGKQDALPVILEVCEQEASERHSRRVDRLRKASNLPPGKTFEAFKEHHLPRPLMQKLRELARADFLERAANVLMFGLPGVGKSHAAAAIGHALVEAGHAVLFTPAYKLVQELLAAKRDLVLPRTLRRLDFFDLLILDDIGYVQQSPEEAEVIFTMMAERYERRSILITSNLVFSAWDRIFKNPMATASAIDRLVHHSVILEFAEVESYRGRKQSSDGKTEEDAEPKPRKKPGHVQRRERVGAAL